MPELPEETKNMIWAVAHETPAADVRTFLKPPAVGADRVPASGVDHLLTSPAILVEFFRRRPPAAGDGTADIETTHEAYVKSLTQPELADIVWRQLFVDNPPISEACRTVLTTLGLWGIDVGSGDLRVLREQSGCFPDGKRFEQSMKMANLELILYPVEALAEDGFSQPPPGVRPVLALDSLLGDWKESARKLRALGFAVKGKIDDFAPLELRRYLAGEIDRLSPAAMSLDWPVQAHPGDSGVGRLVREAALPLCRERGLPFFLAAGDWRSRPDACPPAPDVETLSPLWEDNPDLKFLLIPTHMNQLHSACLAASRRRNLLLGGVESPAAAPSWLEAFTRIRLEAAGASFHYCHSGAETPEELVGRWAHLRWALGVALIRRYAELRRTGWRHSEEDVRKDVKAILSDNARIMLGL